MQKNLLIIIEQLYKGGAQKVVARLSVELSSTYNIRIVTYNKSEGTYQFGGQHIYLDLPYSKNPSRNPFYARLIRFMVLIYRLRKIKKKHSIDVAISFMEASNIVNALSKRKEKVILSVRAHLSKEFRDDKRLLVFKKIIPVLYNRVFKVVVPAEELKEDLAKHFGVRRGKISVIHNFINKDELLGYANEPITEAAELTAFTKSPVLINVGRLTNPKGQWFLPPILKKVKESLPGARLVILGAGPLKERIIQAATECGLSVFDEAQKMGGDGATYDIYLPGFKNNPFPYFRKSNIFVFPSVYEGFPNVILEAMTCGLPVISSDCPSGPREILTEGTSNPQNLQGIEWAEYGALLPVLNDESPDLDKQIGLWADAIVKMFADEKTRNNYIQRSLKRAGDFDRDRVIGSWIALINE